MCEVQERDVFMCAKLVSDYAGNRYLWSEVSLQKRDVSSVGFMQERDVCKMMSVCKKERRVQREK